MLKGGNCKCSVKHLMLKGGNVNKLIYGLDFCNEAKNQQKWCIFLFVYILERRQRSGCGKKLFEYMLYKEGTHPRYSVQYTGIPKILWNIQFNPKL